MFWLPVDGVLQLETLGGSWFYNFDLFFKNMNFNKLKLWEEFDLQFYNLLCWKSK